MEVCTSQLQLLCFSRSSSRPEIVGVIPLFNQDGASCSTRAVVVSRGSSSHKMSAIVLARDEGGFDIEV